MLLLRPLTLGVRVMMIQNDQVLLGPPYLYRGLVLCPAAESNAARLLDHAACREAHEETGADVENI